MLVHAYASRTKVVWVSSYALYFRYICCLLSPSCFLQPSLSSCIVSALPLHGTKSASNAGNMHHLLDTVLQNRYSHIVASCHHVSKRDQSNPASRAFYLGLDLHVASSVRLWLPIIDFSMRQMLQSRRTHGSPSLLNSHDDPDLSSYSDARTAARKSRRG